MDLEITTRPLRDRAVLAVGGEVDLETASQLSDHALAALRDISAHLVLDLTGVSFLDSTGLKVLMAIQRRAELAGGSLVLAGPARPVRRLLSVTGMDQTFTVVESVDDVPVSPAGDPTG